MKQEWDLRVKYGLTYFNLKAILEYESGQLLRFRVKGKHNSLLLECNYPMLKAANSKKGIKWTLREGQFKESSAQNARLLSDLIHELEATVKEYF